MWMLLIVVLSSTPPHNHKGSIFNLYTTETECKQEMNRMLTSIDLKNTKITGNCTFKPDFKD